MSTPTDIVRRSLRLLGVLASGKQPTGAQASDGLERLQSLLLDLPGLLKNGRWRDVAASAAYTAREGDRITVTGSVTVTLPTTVTDCRTGCIRPPLDLAKVQVLGSGAAVAYGAAASGAAGIYLWSASRGAWGPVTGLGQEDELPFGDEDDEGLAAMLAINVADEYGADIPARAATQAETTSRSFRARLKKAEPPDPHRPGGEHFHFRDYR